MQLNQYLSLLLLEKGPLQRSLLGALRSRLPGVYMGLCCASLFATALQQSSVHGFLTSFPNAVTCISAWSMFAMIRQGRMRGILLDMTSFVRAMEDAPGEKLWADRPRRHNAVFGAAVLTGTTFTVIAALFVDTFVTGEPFFELWPLVPLLGAWGRRAASVLSAVTGLYVSVAYCYVFIVLVWFTSIAAGLHHALVARLDSAPCPEVVVEVVAQHRRLRHLVLAWTGLFDGNMAYILAGSTVYALFVTMEVLFRGITPTTAGQLLTLAANFLQLSLFSQELSDASLRLRDAAYCAAVGGLVRLSDARALMLVGLTAGRPPALSIPGLGRFSLANAGKGLHHYYSIVNVLGPRFY